MRYLITLLLIHCFFTHGRTQADSYLHNRTMLERAAVQSGSTNVTFSVPAAPPGLVGDVYLNQDYRPAKFILFDDDKVVTGYAVRLDMRKNEFDIRTEQGIRSLAGSRVKSLEWSDSLTKQPQYFVNAKRFKNEDDVPYLGFFQIMSEGEFILLKKTELIFKEADRSPHHNSGNMDHKFIKRAELFYVRDDHAYKLPARKNVVKMFDAKKPEIDKFIKVNELDLNKDSHVVALFDYYNTLFSKSVTE